MIDQEMFEPYLASGDEMRAIVEQCSGSLSALGSLFGQVTVEDRTALDATEGEIAAQLAIASEQVGHSHQRLEQSTVYAPGAVNLFADAIDRFNLTSESPRSVAKLNQARRQRTSAVLHGTSSGVGSDSDTALLLEFSRLYGQLDVEASQVGGMLTRGPNGDDLRAMFVPLEGHIMVTEPNGRMFFFLNPRETNLAQAGSVSDTAEPVTYREFLELTHLVNGGAPSESERHQGDLLVVADTSRTSIVEELSSLLRKALS